jgi:hypothetical protein
MPYPHLKLASQPSIAALKEKCRARVRMVVSFGHNIDLVVKAAQLDFDVDQLVGVMKQQPWKNGRD